MSVLFKAALGTGLATASGTVMTITTTAAIAVNDLVVVRWAADNLSATTPTGTVTDSGGNTYTAHAFRGNNATAAGGIVGGIAATKATAAVAAGGTITVTLSGAVAHKSCYAESFTGADNTLRNAVVLNSGSSTASTVTSGSATAGDLVVGNMAVESRTNPTYDSDTTNGSWAGNTSAKSATSGTDTACVEANGQYKIVTGTGTQTFNHTNANTDWAAMVAVFQMTPTTPVSASRQTTWNTIARVTATRATTWNVSAATVPAAPTALVATPLAGGTSMALDWDAGADGGSAITDYIVEYRRVDTPDGLLWKGVGSVSRDNLPAELGLVDVSWYYDWANYSDTEGIPAVPATPGVEYVPMMWGDWERVYSGFDIGGPPSESIGNASILLGFNEPNEPSQADVTAARALALWPALEATGCRLGGPAVTADGWDDWMVTFMAGNPRVDFMCVHWYVDFPGPFGTLASILDYVHTTFGLPIWLTEVGNLAGGYAANAALMDSVFATCLDRPWVERIAWYALQENGWTNTNLVTPTPTLTVSGTEYVTFDPKIERLTSVTATRATTWNVAAAAGPAWPFTDAFAYPDGALDGRGGWVGMGPHTNMIVASGKATMGASDGNEYSCVWSVESTTADHGIEADIVVDGTGGHGDASVCTRADANGNCYFAVLVSEQDVQIWLRSGGGTSFTQLGAAAVGASSGRVKLTSVGNVHTAYFNGTQVVQVTDSTHTYKRVAIASYGTGGTSTIDNVEAYDVALTPTSYSDDFNRADGALTTPWVTPEGSHSIASNKVPVGPSSPNMSYYDQTFTNDQWAEADLAGISAGGSTAGVSVRTASSSGGDLYYVWTDGSNHVTIVKRVGGGYTTIATGSVAANGHKVAIEVVGTTLNAYVDGVLATTISDSSITTGKPGIISANGAGATIDNFRCGSGAYQRYFFDDFDRANTTDLDAGGAGLGPIWSTSGRSWQIDSNHAHRSGGNDFTATNYDLGTSDHWVEAVVVPNAYGGGVGGYGCLDIRTLPSLPGCILGFWAPDGRWVIGSTVGGYHDITSISSGAVTFPLLLRLEGEGSALRLYSNNVLVLSTTSSDAIGNTYTGMNAGGEPSFDNYRCGPLPYPGPA